MSQPSHREIDHCSLGMQESLSKPLDGLVILLQIQPTRYFDLVNDILSRRTVAFVPTTAALGALECPLADFASQIHSKHGKLSLETEN